MGEGEERPGPIAWKVELTPTAVRMLGEVKDRRVQRKLAQAIEGLANEPEKQGKPLLGELERYRSLRAVGQRYRIIYRVEAQRVIVLVVALGLRKKGDRCDIYRLAQRLVRLAMAESSPTEEEQPKRWAWFWAIFTRHTDATSGKEKHPARLDRVLLLVV